MDVENLKIYDYVLIQRRQRLDPKGEKFNRSSLIVYSEKEGVNLIKKSFSVRTSERKKKIVKILKSLKFATNTNFEKVKEKVEQNQEYYDFLRSSGLNLLDQRIVCTNLHVNNGKLVEDSRIFSGYIIQPFKEGDINSAREIQIAESHKDIYDIFKNILVSLLNVIGTTDQNQLYLDIKPSNYIKKGSIFIDTQMPWGVKKEELKNFFNEKDFPKILATDIFERLTTEKGLVKKFSEQSISLRPDLKADLEKVILDILSDNKKALVEDLKNYFLSENWKRKVSKYHKRFLEEKNEF